MTALAEIGSFPLLGINIGVAASLSIFNPLLAAFDLMLTGAFGLGSVSADISLQFNAAISVSLSLGLSISNPLASLQLSLSLIAQLTASLQAAISLGLPTISADLSIGLSASLAVSAALGLRLGGIGLLIDLALKLKIPAVNLIADLTASLSAGPVVLLGFGFPTNEQLTNVGVQTQTLFSSGLTGIDPTDEVAGIMMVTKVPAAKVGISALIKTS